MARKALCPEARALLERVRRGHVSAAIELVEVAEREGMTEAGRLWFLVADRTDRMAHWYRHDFSRDRTWSRWDSVGVECRVLIGKIRNLFGRKWKLPDRRTLWRLNRDTAALLAGRQFLLEHGLEQEEVDQALARTGVLPLLEAWFTDPAGPAGPVFADWLEDEGLGAQARFVRLTVSSLRPEGQE